MKLGRDLLGELDFALHTLFRKTFRRGYQKNFCGSIL